MLRIFLNSSLVQSPVFPIRMTTQQSSYYTYNSFCTYKFVTNTGNMGSCNKGFFLFSVSKGLSSVRTRMRKKRLLMVQWIENPKLKK